jgi:hypothetical protein
MHGHYIARRREGEHHLQLFLVAVAGDVGLVVPLVDHLAPLPEQLVDGAVDQVFVAGDGGGGDYDKIAVGHLDIFMFAGRH